MEAVLKKVGKSTVLVIPPLLLEAVGISAGRRLLLEITVDGKIVLTPKRKFDLADMIAKCDLEAAPPADLVLWDVSRPAGRELL